jgi:Spy/CpxP family protein refolding chaperone
MRMKWTGPALGMPSDTAHLTGVPRTTMARLHVWLPALVLACTSAAAAATLEGAGIAGDTVGTVQGARDHDKSPQRAAQPPSERGKWWLYDRVELGITDEQSQAINDIFEATIPGLRAARQELDRAEEELSRTIKAHTADIAVVSHQLDRVESARSQHNKMRTLMLYRIHALLSPDQRVKLEALRARQAAARGDRPQGSGR